MSFKIDKQTLDDLTIFGNNRTKSAYDIFNRTRTRGGAKILEEMFLYPLSDADQINERSDVIRYYRDIEAEFPFRGEIFDTMEFYLGNTDRRTQLMTQDNTLGRKFKNLVGTDTEYTQIHNGIVCCIELLNTLDAFLKNSKADAGNKTIAELTASLRGLLGNEKWSWYVSEKGKKKLGYEQAVVYDRVLRFEERDKLMKILYYVYLLDVYMAVANVAKERGFVFAKAHPNDKNTLVMKGVFHPFLTNPVGNTITVDENSNVIFLTGANMAGKSTFLRAIGVNLVLACCGAVVRAESFEFQPMALFTSMRTVDNLAKGTSYFHAELLRLQQLVNMAQHEERLFIILDEILKGTNSRDKLNGSRRFLQKLLTLPVAGLVATHDLELGELANTIPDNFFNRCFEITHTDDDIAYDYKLKPGISQNMNASILLEKMKLV